MLQREEQGVNARSLTHQITDSIFNNGPEMSQDAPDVSQWPNTETGRDEEERLKAACKTGAGVR
jgi:hypothetical protein